MTPTPSNARRWAVAVATAVVVMFLIVTVSLFVSDRVTGGPAAREAALTGARLLRAQQAAAIRSECVTAYRGEWQNAVGDIVLVASRGNDPAPDQVRALAAAQRHSLRINDLCDPTQPRGPRFPADPKETP